MPEDLGGCQKMTLDNSEDIQYRQKLVEEVYKLQEIIEKNLPDMFEILMACLSVKAQMLIEGINLPFFLVLVGRASGSKTTILGCLEILQDSIKTYNITSKSFVSHIANVKQEDLKEIDLLPRIKNKMLITPELGTMFSTREDKLLETLGILTTILDGKGYRSESGVHGSRGYDGDYYFTWIGAIPKLSDHLLKILGNLGPKIYFLRLNDENLTDEEEEQKILDAITGKKYAVRLAEVQQQTKAVWDVLESYIKQHGKIKWDTQKDDIETVQKIVSSAAILSKLRVPIHYEKHPSEKGFVMEVESRELPTRAATLLLYIAKGHAVLHGRNYVVEDDLGVVLDVALSSAFKKRARAFRALLENKGEINTQELADKMNVAKQTALNQIKELVVVGLGEFIHQPGRTKPFDAIQLNKRLHWLLEDKYKKYWKRS